MLKMKTLTVGDQTWQVCDPEAARIDDAAVGENAWSSKNLMDRLCPAFTQTGEVVSCEPAQGYPLGAVTELTAAEGVTELTLHRRGKNLLDIRRLLEASGWSVDEEGVYSGDIGSIYRTFNNTKGGLLTGCFKPNTRYTIKIEGKNDTATADAKKTTVMVYVNYTDGTSGGLGIKDPEHTAYTYITSANKTVGMVYITYSYDGTTYIKSLSMCEGLEATDEPYRGEDVTVALGKTVTGGSYDWTAGVLTDESGEVTRLTPLAVPGWAGENTLWCGGGQTTVTGRRDIRSLLESLSI